MITRRNQKVCQAMVFFFGISLFSFAFQNAHGAVLWSKTIGGEGTDMVYGMLPKQSGYILTGYTTSFGANQKDVCLVSTTSDGHTNWIKTIGGEGDDVGYSVVRHPTGYMIAGYSIDPYTTGHQVLMIKTNAAGEEVWTRKFGGWGRHHGRSMQRTSDGGYIIVGDTSSYPNGPASTDVYLIRTDVGGNVIWEKTHGGDGWDYGMSVQETSDGGFIVAGYSNSYGDNSHDVYVLKTDAEGDEEWHHTFGDSGDDRAYAVQQNPVDGSFIIAGYEYTSSSRRRDAYLIKLHANGTHIWSYPYGRDRDESAESVQITSDGGYIVSGYTRSFGRGHTSAYLLRTDADGNRIWDQAAGGSGYDHAYAVHETANGDYVIAGTTTSHDAQTHDVYLARIIVDGKERWSKVFGSERNEDGLSVQQTRDGGYIIAGYTEDPSGNGTHDIYLVKTLASGREDWKRIIEGYGDDYGLSVQQTSDGGYIIAGYTIPAGKTDKQVYLLKTKPDGYPEWQNKFGGSGDDYGYAVQQTLDGGYMVAGYSRSFGNKTQGYMVKARANGHFDWQMDHGGADNDTFASIQQTLDGGYILAGRSTSFGHGDGQVYLVKTNPSGKEEWKETFGEDGNEFGMDVQVTGDGGFIITGSTNKRMGGTEYDYYLVKTDEAGKEEWSRVMGGTGNDFAHSVQQTFDGGYILGGTTTSFGPLGENVYLVRTDEFGIEKWSNTYGGDGKDYGKCVRQTLDGGYVIAGSTDSLNAAGSDFYLVKTLGPSVDIHWGRSYGGVAGRTVLNTQDGGFAIAGHTRTGGNYDAYLVKTWSNGAVQWNGTFGGDGYDLAHDMKATTDGGYILVGGTTSYGTGDYDVFLVKTDADGQELWAYPYGGSDYDFGFSVHQTQDGGYIIAGTTESFGPAGCNAYLLKTDADGTQEWQQAFGGNGWDDGYAVLQTADGGYIMAGRTGSSATGFDMYLVKTDAGGNEIWQYTFGGSGLDEGYSMQETRDGGFIIAGNTIPAGAGRRDVYLVKVNRHGEEIWTETYGGKGNECGYSVMQTHDNGFIIGGYTDSFGAGKEDYYLVKTDPHGMLQWSKTLGSGENERGYSVCQNKDGSYAIVGRREASNVQYQGVYLFKTTAFEHQYDPTPRVSFMAPRLPFKIQP